MSLLLTFTNYMEVFVQYKRCYCFLGGGFHKMLLRLSGKQQSCMPQNTYIRSGEKLFILTCALEQLQ